MKRTAHRAPASRRPAPRSSRLTPHAASAIAIAIAVALAGCGTTAPRRSTTIERAPAAAPSASAPRGGGYYLDDGPGANPPPDLDSVPDAVPRAEPLARGASRPYVVMGRTYTPMTRLAPYKARGTASWYGRRYNGKPTSSGEPYDMYAMTAAHPTLPIPSYARVTNLSNGRSVIVRVNDRGPFLSDRIIDLSYTAAYKLGILNGGSAPVEVEAIMPEDYATVIAASKAPSARAQTTAAPQRDPAAVIAALGAPADAATTAAPDVPESTAATRPADGGTFLQLGAFGSRENAEAYLAQLRAQLQWLSDRLQVLLRDGYYRVNAGPYASAGDARSAADRITDVLGKRPLLVTR